MYDHNIMALIGILGDCETAKQDQEFLFSCPFCRYEKKRLSVNPTKTSKRTRRVGVFQCFHCNRSGSLRYLLSFLGLWADDAPSLDRFDSTIALLRAGLDLADPESTRVNYSPIEREEWYPTIPPGSQAEAFLRQRGIGPREIMLHRFGIGAGRYRGRVILPEIENDEIIFFQARATDGREPKYMSPPGNRDWHLWNWDVARGFPDVVICEGIFSAMACLPGAVATYSTNFLSGQVVMLARGGFDTYTICYDPEPHAWAQANAMALALVDRDVDPESIRCAMLPIGKDPHDVGREGMREVIARAPVWGPMWLTNVCGGLYGN
jgi:hypothetical protein